MQPTFSSHPRIAIPGEALRLGPSFESSATTIVSPMSSSELLVPHELWVAASTYKQPPTAAIFHELSQAGPVVFDALVRIQERTIPAGHTAILRCPLSVSSDSMQALLGISSATFLYNKTTAMMTAQSHVRMVGTSTAAIASVLQRLAGHATALARIKAISSVLSVLPGRMTASLGLSLARCHAEWQVQLAHQWLLTASLLTNLSAIDGVCTQARRLAVVLGWPTETPTTNMAAPRSFNDVAQALPVGLALVVAVLRWAQQAEGGPDAGLYLVLFRAVSHPFIMSMRDWVWNGELTDAGSESGFTININTLHLRTARYWVDGVSCDHRMLEELLLPAEAASLSQV